MKYIVIVCLFVYLIPMSGLAQIGITTTINITSNPRLPEPTQFTTLSLNAYTIDTTGSTIRWFEDNEEIITAVNARTLEVQAPQSGESKVIRAEINQPNGQKIVAVHTINPVQLDLVIEALTRVPTFYEGRALPSSGSLVRAIALLPSSGFAPNELSYRWEVANNVLYGGAVTGKNIAEFTTPTLARDVELTLDVLINATGEIIASDSIIIPIVTPELYFYPDNPLRGTALQAIGNTYNLLEEEVDIRAEPYYMDTNILSAAPLLEWSINGQSVINPGRDQQVITLKKTGDTGKFNISFHIRNRSQLLQGAEESFQVIF